jgi:hypothetical protein
MFKKLLNILLEPLKAFANRNFAEKTAIYFSKNKWMVYVLSVIVTLVMLALFYVVPNL